MCKKPMIINNMDIILKKYTDVKKLLLNLDNNIRTNIRIESF